LTPYNLDHPFFLITHLAPRFSDASSSQLGKSQSGGLCGRRAKYNVRGAGVWAGMCKSTFTQTGLFWPWPDWWSSVHIICVAFALSRNRNGSNKEHH
jgi:hypothetical protein